MNKPKSLLTICASLLTFGCVFSIVASRKVYDITHKITTELPVYGSANGMGEYIWLDNSMKNGSNVNTAQFKLSTHTGTHVDAPSHFFQDYYENGVDVTTLDLNLLNGRAILVDVPKDKNITAEVMKSLNIPKGVKRVLFRTLNTNRRLMHKKEFHSDFVGFTASGANWLVKNTNIRLVGLDYLSIATVDEALPVHLTFLKNRNFVVVEGLNLDDVKSGVYDLHCLPLRLSRADGCPARCILFDTKKDH